MSYATPADLAVRFDESTISDLASDTGEPVADISTDTNVLAAMEDASGRVDAALLMARMYSPADLGALTGNSQGLLKRIVCELAMAFLIERRPEKFNGDRPENVRRAAEDYLDLLRRGERIFNVEGVKDAGLPEIDGPTVTQYNRLNLLPDRTRNYYPRRGKRLPIGREG